MSCITDLPQNVLLHILQFCKVKELVSISSTCSFLYQLTKDQFLWKKLCYRDFQVHCNSCENLSCETIYKHLLHKYGHMLGVYQCKIGPFGGLLEIRFNQGRIEGVSWEPADDNVMSPLKEFIAFTVHGRNDAPTKCLCLPSLEPHECTLRIDKRNGVVTLCCSNTKKHIEALHSFENPGPRSNILMSASLKLVFLDDAICTGLVHRPLILPKSDDIPRELRRKDGSFPRQIITPGLFRGTYSAHGIELILFRYYNEHEIRGLKVTGDNYVHAGKVSIKINLKYQMDVPPTEKNAIPDLLEIEPKSSNTPLDQIPEQKFSVPDSCYFDTSITSIQIPDRCLARYHGLGQIASSGFKSPTYIKVHVVIFNNDLLGVIWIDLGHLSLYSRIDQKFTSNRTIAGGSFL